MDKTVKGLDKVLKKLQGLGVEAEKGIDRAADNATREIAVLASSRAPNNTGELQSSISHGKVDFLKYETVVNEIYGAYVEFGTGAKVSVPPEMQALASRIKSNPSGTFQEGLQSIKDWCKTKGIPETAAYPIFMSILKKGITPQPYFYPSFVEGRQTYLKDLQSLLKRLTK